MLKRSVELMQQVLNSLSPSNQPGLGDGPDHPSIPLQPAPQVHEEVH
jgi:hypothetical protein